MADLEQVTIVAVQNIYLTERFDAVLYPIDLLMFLRALPAKGWIVPKRLATDGDALAFDAPPTKGGLRIRLDIGNKTLGVSGDVLTEVITGFREIRDVARSIGEFAPEVKTHFIEFRYVGLISGQRNPAEAFADRFNDGKHISNLIASLNRQVPTPETTLSVFGIRLAPKGLDPNRPNWAELSVYPVNIYGNRLYHLDLLYRNTDPAAVEKVAEGAEGIVKTAISKIEG